MLTLAITEVFDEGNQRFAAAYVRPHQRATLTTRLLFDGEQSIRFRSWEATRGVQLSMCCGRECPFRTEIGVKRGSRNWLDHEVTCPKGTDQVSSHFPLPPTYLADHVYL